MDLEENFVLNDAGGVAQERYSTAVLAPGYNPKGHPARVSVLEPQEALLTQKFRGRSQTGASESPMTESGSRQPNHRLSPSTSTSTYLQFELAGCRAHLLQLSTLDIMYPREANSEGSGHATDMLRIGQIRCRRHFGWLKNGE